MSIQDRIKKQDTMQMAINPFSKSLRAKMCWDFTFSKLTEKQIMERLGLTSSEWNAMLYGSLKISLQSYKRAIKLMENNHVQTK